MALVGNFHATLIEGSLKEGTPEVIMSQSLKMSRFIVFIYHNDMEKWEEDLILRYAEDEAGQAGLWHESCPA